MDRHSCESRNPVKLSPADLDACFRGHDEINTPTAQLMGIYYLNFRAIIIASSQLQ
jgi:hypothetical protein